VNAEYSRPYECGNRFPATEWARHPLPTRHWS